MSFSKAGDKAPEPAEMKCEMAVLFPSAREARVAGEILRTSIKAGKGSKISFSSSGRALSASISSPSFSELRALSTTVFRDLKMVLDSSQISGKR